MSSNDKNQVLSLYKSWLIDSFLFTGVGLALGKFISPSLFIFVAIASIILCLIVSFSRGKLKLYSMFAFNAVMGIDLYYILMQYAANDILTAGLITVLTTMVCVYVATRPGKDFSGWGIYLFIALLGTLIYELIAFFIHLPSINGIFVALFAFYTVYDVNLFKNRLEYNEYMSDEEIVMHVINFYLDIFNLFIRILSIVAKRDD